MESAFATEQAFNFSSAEHRKGTNRYTFTYPEHWKSNQDKCDLSVGIRNIIFMPPKIRLDFSNWYIMDKDVDMTKDFGLDFNHEDDRDSETGALKDARPIVAHRTIFNYHMPIGFSVECEDKTITQICEEIDNKYNTEYTKWYNDMKCNDTYHLDDYKLDRDILKATFTHDGYFMLSTEADYYIAIPAEDVDNRTAFDDDFLQFVGIDPSELENFHIQFALQYNIPSIGPGGDPTYFTRKNIEFKDCKELIGTMMVESVDEQGNDICIEVPAIKYYMFKSIHIANVFSRNNLMLTSSIAEDDKNNYLGISNPNNYLNYGKPKNYHVVAAHDKFWVDLYDTMNQQKVELPKGSSLIMECSFKQKPREVLSRVNGI